MTEVAHNKPPHLFYSSVELPRVLQEMSLLLPAHSCLRKNCGGDGQPVMTLPGFGAGDYSTAILRRYLRRWGYDARPWEAGPNMNPREMNSFDALREHMQTLLQFLTARLEKINAETQRPIALIGWSLGGIVSRLLASSRPELVSQIISLGTPYGDFRSTVLYPLMSRINGDQIDQADVDAWQDISNAPLENVPLTVVYSKSDGFVAPHIATMPRGEWVENIAVVSSHVGFAVNPIVLNLVSGRLATPNREWQPYKPQGMARLLYKIT